MRTVNILVTLNENYIPYLNVMLFSLLRANPEVYFAVYLLHSSVRPEAVSGTRQVLGGRGELTCITVNDANLKDAPTTDRYPQEMYYRIFAARYLPDTLDRVLYLDPDIIVNGSILLLYDLAMEDYYFAAASHTGKAIHLFNEIRLDMDGDSPYINSGVMLMNLSLLRREQNYEDVFRFIQERKGLLLLPDQDIISGLYGSRIYALNPFRYNMTERLFQAHAPFIKGPDLDWVRAHAVIIHYCGRNKPWKAHYQGQLDVFYREAVSSMWETSGETGALT